MCLANCSPSEQVRREWEPLISEAHLKFNSFQCGHVYCAPCLDDFLRAVMEGRIATKRNTVGGTGWMTMTVAPHTREMLQQLCHSFPPSSSQAYDLKDFFRYDCPVCPLDSYHNQFVETPFPSLLFNNLLRSTSALSEATADIDRVEWTRVHPNAYFTGLFLTQLEPAHIFDIMNN